MSQSKGQTGRCRLDRMDNPLVLLGAGASVDAGIPASTDMTERITKEITSPRNRYLGVAHALNYAIGALIAHKAARGGDPYEGIDIEQLFSAVQMLGDRESLEIAPFVTWSPVLQTIGPEKRIPAFFDEKFTEYLAGKGFQKPGALIQELVASMILIDDSEPVFRKLEEEMLGTLTQLLSVETANLDYLSPLVPGGDDVIRIATLNYDRSIETLAAAKGVSLDTGISGWRGGHDWTWEESARVRLLKLHGSIDWTLTSTDGSGGLEQSAIQISGPLQKTATRFQGKPGVVFGTRGKVRAEGPFLAMLQAFDEMLREVNRVVIVGYSFRDEHINVALSRWINSAPQRALTVVDPNFMNTATERGTRHTYPASLLRAAHYFDYETQQYKRGVDLHVIPQFAKDGLEQAMTDPTAGRVPPESGTGEQEARFRP